MWQEHTVAIISDLNDSDANSFPWGNQKSHDEILHHKIPVWIMASMRILQKS